jgi:hypothetical protein
MDNQTSLPFAAGSETSREAAERMAEQPTRIRRDHESILNVLLSGPKTDREIQTILGMSGDTQRPRRGELVAMGRVVNTGQRRQRSALWALASMTQVLSGA